MIPQVVAVKSAWSAIVGILTNRWVQISVLAALLALFWARGNHYQESRDLWRTASEKQAEAYTAAQRAAELALEAQRAKQTADYMEAKRHADQQQKSLSEDYERRLADYVSRMRVEADRRAASGPAAAGQDQAAGSAETADAQAGLVGVTEHDLKLLVQAVADIEAARAWADALIKADLAE